MAIHPAFPVVTCIILVALPMLCFCWLARMRINRRDCGKLSNIESLLRLRKVQINLIDIAPPLSMPGRNQNDYNRLVIHAAGLDKRIARYAYQTISLLEINCFEIFRVFNVNN